MHPVPRAASLPRLLIVPMVAIAALLPAAPARAESCTTNIQGIVASDGATMGQPEACAPQVGRPEGTGTGRKVG